MDRSRLGATVRVTAIAVVSSLATASRSGRVVRPGKGTAFHHGLPVMLEPPSPDKSQVDRRSQPSGLRLQDRPGARSRGRRSRSHASCRGRPRPVNSPITSPRHPPQRRAQRHCRRRPIARTGLCIDDCRRRSCPATTFDVAEGLTPGGANRVLRGQQLGSTHRDARRGSNGPHSQPSSRGECCLPAVSASGPGNGAGR